ncbi:MAG: DUF5659 domain-containing protein [Thermodesulfobacteriota bacterium]
MLKLIHDVDLVAYLLAMGFKQAQPAKYHQGKVIFSFDDSKGEIKEAITKFFNKDAPVDALTHAEYITSLKSQIIIMKRNSRQGGGQDE